MTEAQAPGTEDASETEPPEVPGPMRILLLEDDQDDAALEQHLLKKAGLDITAVIVWTKEEFAEQLASFRPHAIVADYAVPGFSGEAALGLTRERSPQVPFIFVSGALGDEGAAELIRKGATDYVLKDRMARLPSVIRSAVEAARQEAQRVRLEAQLQQSQRLDSLGQLAGGIAHDFNNLLGIISSYASFVGEEAAKEPADVAWPELRADVRQIELAVHRAARLTRQLLAFGRRDVVHPTVLSLNDVVTDVTELLVRTIGEHIELHTFLGTDLRDVLIDPGQLEQVLVNLAVNSRDAMPLGGTLTIETANTELDEVEVAGRAHLRPGSYVTVKVSDTGAGMPPEVQQRVFEPFFTTKERGAGTGLGLAMSYGIITQAGGTVRIYSEPGMGTTMTVLLPATQQHRRPVAPAVVTAVPGAGTVLVAEDEDALREVTRRMLESGGYQVLTAASGPEAIQIAAAHGPIDILVTDVVMPQMLGREVAELIRAQQPGVHVLFMSGYAHGILGTQGVLEPGINLIEKPFSRALLLSRLAEIQSGEAE